MSPQPVEIAPEPLRSKLEGLQVPGGDADYTVRLIQELHRPSMREAVEDTLGVGLSEVDLQSQVFLLDFMAGANRETNARLGAVMKARPELGANFLESFVLLAEDRAHGETLLGLGEALAGHGEAAGKLFGTYRELLERAQKGAPDLLMKLAEQYPGSGLTEHDVVLALMARGRDLLVDARSDLERRPGTASEVMGAAVGSIHELPLENQVVEEQFKLMARLLGGQNVDLGQYEAAQQMSARGLDSPELRDQVFATLARYGHLKPIPEVHWRVDRNLSEYGDRFGLDLGEVLKGRIEGAPDGAKQTLLELGPGSGKMLEEVTRADWAQGYREFGMANAAYFSVEQVFGELIDFDALESQIGATLDENERKALAHYLYTCTVIKPGQTGQDQFEYDEAAMEQLSDINGLKGLIPGLAERLRQAEAVPTGISTRTDTGKVVYPYKLRDSELNASTVEALAALRDGGVWAYVKPELADANWWETVEAFPANVMMGDFSQIGRLNPDQIDVAVASRSTVYLRDEEYVGFMADLRARMRPGGMIVDDSIRDNDGWYYRLAELKGARSRIAAEGDEWLVVLGPGFAGEDLRSDEVPRSLIVTREGSSKAQIEGVLGEGCRVVVLEELTDNPDSAAYLKSLDSTGRTHDQLMGAI